MDPDSKQTIQVAALGRPFSLGMLYDCRKDSLIPGMTLWDHGDLLNHIGERPQCYNDFEIVASESIEVKTSALNVDASLKLSLLCGLITVGGSAKYLDDHKKSKNQARVTLKYEATTKFQELSMNHLGRGNVKHQHVFQEGEATHVVTAILYGAQAFFVFDREVSEEEDHQVVQGKLKFMINMIPCIKDGGSLKLKDTYISSAEKFSCKFHGDFFLEENPVSYQDAVQVYQSLSKRLGANRENAVPLKVWLLPLICLDPSATQLVRQISTALALRVQSVLEHFFELDMRCNDAMKTTIAQQFHEIGEKLKTFKEHCFDFKVEFQQDLAKKIPSIRGGVKEEVKEILNTFNMDKLMWMWKWMDYAEKEIYILQSFSNMMKDIKIVPSENDLYKETLSAEHTVCFVFTPLGSAQPYLSASSKYLNETVKSVPPETKVILDAMRHKAKLFSDFAQANKDNNNIKFLTVCLPNEAQRGPSIHLYKDGFPVTEDFEPPSKPETVTESDNRVTHNSVTLTICPPRFGTKNITLYSVEYCVSGEDEWQQTRPSSSTAGEAAEVTVSKLRPGTQYMFRCKAITSAGVGPARDVHHSIKTLPKPKTEYKASCKCGIAPKSKETITVHVCTKTCEFPQASQSVLEDFTELEMRCNNAMRTPIAQQFPQIGKKLQTFKELCSVFKLELQLTLAKTLPSILEGGEEEVVLADILKKRLSSPFNNTNLNRWMDCKEKEICTLISFTNMMKNTKVITSEKDLYKEIFSVEHAVCFVFTSLGSAEPYLSDLSNYLSEKVDPDHPQYPQTQDAEREQWFLSKDVSDGMRHKAKLFSDFAEANKEDNNIKFLTVGLPNKAQKGTSIYLYKEGLPVTEDFEPPSKAETVTESDITHNSVTLNICPPQFGAKNITSYSVEYCVSGEDEWQQTKTSTAHNVAVSGLRPATQYMFRCRAVTSAGVGPAREFRGPIKTLPTSPPGKPQVKSLSREISVSWEKPAEVGQVVDIMSYIVEYAKTDCGVEEKDLQWNQMVSRAEEAIIPGLQPETEYAVRVRCECGVAGRSKESSMVNVRTTKCLADLLKCTSKCINPESPSLYKLPLKEEHMDIAGCRKYSFGKESMSQNRTILLFGATGSGKSTLINAMINYIVGVEWDDNFRFKLIDEGQLISQTENQTPEVTVYEINHQEGFKIPFSLTVVDTPGFVNTNGIEADKEIRQQIRRLFTSVNGVCEIDAICFVAQACITSSQKYVFNSVLSMFGKDVAENIRVLVTFADGKHPPVIEAINALGVLCTQAEDKPPVVFKFNNSALFEDKKSSAASIADDDAEEDESLHEMFWNMGTKTMKRFFVALNVVSTKSLTMTKEVLREREQLETSVEDLQNQVKLGQAKLVKMNAIAEMLEDCEAEITRNQNFEFEFIVKKPVQHDISTIGHHVTNCPQCLQTCHYPCCIPNNEGKKGCAAMGGDGYCTECPGKCKWNVHLSQTYRWEYEEVREKRTVPELKEKYVNAIEVKEAMQLLHINLWNEYEFVQIEVMQLMERSSKCLNRLKEMALKPNPVSTPEYIDLLIEGEKSEAKPGWRERVQSLIVVKEQAEYMVKVDRG